MFTHTTHRYHGLLIGLHWLMAGLIVAAYAVIELKGFFPKGSEPRLLMKSIHYGLGLSVLGFAVLRVLTRLTVQRTTPKHTDAVRPAMPRLQHRLSQSMHWALYGFMLAMPVLGWLLLSAKGESVQWFGWSLPMLIAENITLSDTLEELHETLGSIGYALIGLHALAGLWHHYVQRDNRLTRMLPWLKS